MKVKKGVNVQGISNEIMLAVMVANDVYKDHEKELVITSALEGKHSFYSLHYSGNAVDLRTRYFTDKEKLEVAQDIRSRLTKHYDVVVSPNHIHIEYQPRR